MSAFCFYINGIIQYTFVSDFKCRTLYMLDSFKQLDVAVCLHYSIMFQIYQNVITFLLLMDMYFLNLSNMYFHYLYIHFYCVSKSINSLYIIYPIALFIHCYMTNASTAKLYLLTILKSGLDTVGLVLLPCAAAFYGLVGTGVTSNDGTACLLSSLVTELLSPCSHFMQSLPWYK